MELHHQRLVFGANRPNRRFQSVLHFPWRNILRGIRPDGGARQVCYPRLPRHAATIRASRASNAPGDASSGLMSISLIRRLLDDKLAEAHQNLFKCGHIHGSAPANTLQRLETLAFAPSAAAPTWYSSGGRASARSRYTSTSCPPEPNRITGPNCASTRTAQNEFVPVQPHHRLNRDSKKACRARLLRQRKSGWPEMPRRTESSSVKVQLHAADIGLVRDRFRMDFQHDRESERLGQIHCFFRAPRDLCRNCGNSVERPASLSIRLRSKACGPRRRTRARISSTAPTNRLCRFRLIGEMGVSYKPAHVVAVTPHIVECPGRRVRIGECRNAGGVQNGLASRDYLAAHPACQDWFAVSFA